MVLVLILAALGYGIFIGVPAALQFFQSEQQANREMLKSQIELLRSDDREQRSLDRKTFEKITEDQAVWNREVLERVLGFKIGHAAAP